MAKQQDESKLAVIGRGLEILATMDPNDVKMSIKTEDLPEQVVDILGWPKGLKRSPLEKKQIQEEQKKERIALEQAALAQGGGQ